MKRNCRKAETNLSVSSNDLICTTFRPYINGPLGGVSLLLLRHL